ncbi:MAG: glutamine--tRNA ligase/YqeY domain fusion protein [Rhodothermales bacterium]
MAEATPPGIGSAGEDDDRTGSNFIRSIIESDLREGRVEGGIVTRFPPEPNGYLHIGHAKSICLNFGLVQDFEGVCNLRFDDTNPATEDIEYVEAIKRDVRWLGFDWDDREFYASDYFEQLYAFAEQLIRSGHAYVDSLDEDEIRAMRGTVTEAGRESPYRSRSIEENLDFFRRMRAGEFSDGEHVLRAKGDMASSNMKMRDPLLYRIRHARHYRSGDEWCIYPMYDFAHPLSDAIEEVTHSLCTLEFDNNRELYDWVVEHTVGEPRPHQYEFARLNLDYTVMSKRKLLRLVQEGLVSGWDDPRMPTIAGLRRRGVTPESIRSFCDTIGVAKADSRVGIDLLEYTIRDDLNFKAPRVMCVLRPLRVVVTNFPEDKVEELDASYWPRDVPKEATRTVPFTRELFIDREDFREDAPKGFYRLAPGREVRLRYGYFIRCQEVVKDDDGVVVELRCTYDPETRGGSAPDGRKVRGTIHWVSATASLPAEVRLYDRLFHVPDPEAGDGDFTEHLNPHSLIVAAEARIEPSVSADAPATRYQFEREGYFWQDPHDSEAGRLVFNRIVPLRDTWAKIEEARAKTDEPARSRSEEEPASPPPPTTAERVEALSGPERERFEALSALGLSDADAVILTENPDVAEYFEATRDRYDEPEALANWVVNELLRALKDQSLESFPVSPADFADLVRLIEDDVISARIAKDVFEEMIATGNDARAIVDERGLVQVADPEALTPIVDDVLSSNPDKVTAYREGKHGLIGFFIGQVMKQTDGKAKPELVREILEVKLAR